MSKKAFVVTDNDSGAAVVFAKSSVAARRIGANELDIEFEGVESCRRAAEFDGYADQGFVPAEVLIEHGWRFECAGCDRWVNSDREGLHRFHGLERLIRLKPVFGNHLVFCCPSCETRAIKRNRNRDRAW